jgi:hypothetical protein
MMYFADDTARVVEDADPYDAAFPVGRDAHIAPRRTS